MIVTIKFIAGQECDLEVEADYTISAIKRLLSRHFDVPVDHQRLVFKGKILADAQCLCDYDIVAGTKIHLTIKKPEGRAFRLEESKAKTRLVEQLRIDLKPHFSPSDLDKIVDQFCKDLEQRVENSSLDDIERVACHPDDVEIEGNPGSSALDGQANKGGTSKGTKNIKS